MIFAEAFSDFFHFDSRFFKSFIPFFFKPGFLTREYLAGRRVRYIHPLRLYFFVSIVMLLLSSLLFARFDYNKILKKIADRHQQESSAIIQHDIRHWQQLPISPVFSLAQKKHKIDSVKASVLAVDTGFLLLTADDPVRQRLLSRVKDGSQPLAAIMGKNGALYRTLQEFATHDLKVFLIFLLPVFALYLQLLYRRKKIHYQDNLITMLHLQSFLILFITLIYFMPVFFPGSWTLVNYLALALSAVYIFFTLLNVYGQNYFRTFLKTAIFLFLACFTLALAGSAYILYEVMREYKAAS